MKVLLKSNIPIALLFLSILLLAGQAQATTIPVEDLGDLGGLDTLLGSCDLLNSGPDAEAECFNSIESIDGVTADMLVQIDFSVDPVAADEIFTVDGDEYNSIAIIIDPDTEYFLIKTGNIDATFDAYVYLNNDAFDWAYIDLDLTSITEISQISHLTQVVPVPTAAWLFGSAMLGLVGVARRKSAA